MTSGGLSSFANFLQRFEAVDAGQPDVEQDHIESDFAQQFETGLATVDRRRGIAFVGQDAG